MPEFKGHMRHLCQKRHKCHFCQVKHAAYVSNKCVNMGVKKGGINLRNTALCHILSIKVVLTPKNQKLQLFDFSFVFFRNFFEF